MSHVDGTRAHSDPAGGTRRRRRDSCRRTITRVAAGAPEGLASGRDRHDGLPAGRIGHGQGSGRPLHSSPSPRKNGPFVAINCAALPEQLLESELFGYERGAFTGAHQAKPGQIELASTGVLFLDEVSEMSPMAQAKLLRFLQEREFRRLGGTRLVKVNVRVIAASNRDLQKAVTDGSFREDLFYRLRVFDIYLPPLRERRSDIPLLTAAFLQDFKRSSGCAPGGLTPDALEMLERYDWPGNVRELHNALERAAILCRWRSDHPRTPLPSAQALCDPTPADPAVGCRAAARSSRCSTSAMGTSRRPHAGWALHGRSSTVGSGSTPSQRPDNHSHPKWCAPCVLEHATLFTSTHHTAEPRASGGGHELALVSGKEPGCKLALIASRRPTTMPARR